MNAPSRDKSVLAFALAAAMAAGVVPGSPAIRDAHAAGIQRCVAPDGTTLYTDQPCEQHDAEAVAMPNGLTARLADARQAEVDTGSAVGATSTGYVDASLPLYPADRPRAATARRSAAAGCARSPTQLAMDLQGAFALGDVNQIAESYHWVGMGQQAANGVMQRLERLAVSTVVDTRFYDASIVTSGIGSWADAGGTVDAGAGVMQLTLGGEGGAAVLDLEVERYDGCYFVHF